jgi:hypothetical protein
MPMLVDNDAGREYVPRRNKAKNGKCSPEAVLHPWSGIVPTHLQSTDKLFFFYLSVMLLKKKVIYFRVCRSTDVVV